MSCAVMLPVSCFADWHTFMRRPACSPQPSKSLGPSVRLRFGLVVNPNYLLNAYVIYAASVRPCGPSPRRCDSSCLRCTPASASTTPAPSRPSWPWYLCPSLYYGFELVGLAHEGRVGRPSFRMPRRPARKADPDRYLFVWHRTDLKPWRW
ncbi:hypothetical protein N656DRAFT_780743 [Canariomyces notabilis]|uniref:Uncharacterized protein n=1 Tax=Canariomyces notabilis TaxID=2074819 RepID=A0AAN6TBR9_9PEZI|nr:hypothetical protein N656DRAFT_780743 [Canariomyces arenarius]